jgi:hypothetical protein
MITKRIRRGEGFFWLAMGIFIGIVAMRTGVGAVKEPGPGFIALAAGLFMAGVGLVMILTALLGAVSIRKGGPLSRVLSSISWSRVLCTLGLLFGYAFLLDRLGHVLATFLVMWGLFYDWDKKNPVISLLLSVLVTGISYLFFEKLLLVRFPKGIWP